ncbi:MULTISPECIES: hypothetical protein [Sphingobium]|nr:hypothetical protein [Sphingobium sp. MI1205]
MSLSAPMAIAPTERLGAGGAKKPDISSPAPSVAAQKGPRQAHIF